MNGKENSTFYNYGNNLLSLDGIDSSKLSPIKNRKRTDVNSYLYNGEIEHIKKHKSLRCSKGDNRMIPLNLTNYNNFKENRNILNNNQSYSGIIQKEILYSKQNYFEIK